MNTDNSEIIKSNREAGQNITIKVYVDDVLVSQTTEITDENGSIFFIVYSIRFLPFELLIHIMLNKAFNSLDCKNTHLALCIVIH